MQLQDWILLDAFQAGALIALAIAYGADGLSRRDRLMGWMAFGCLLLGLRHAVPLLPGSAFEAATLFPERWQILLAAGGFLSLCMALVHLFPRHLSGRFPAWVALGLLPNLVRAAWYPLGPTPNTILAAAASVTYLASCGAMLWAAQKARILGDPMGTRFFLGLLGASFPLVVGAASRTLFHLDLHLSGFSMLLLATVVGSSWQWLATQSLRDQLRETEEESEAWRSLVPGTTFRTDQPSVFMEATFGPTWSSRIRYEEAEHLVALDGATYRIRERTLPRRHRLGWVGLDDQGRPGLGGFLAGWTVALGMDPSAEAGRIEGWLRAWGADIEIWSTVPPREGPYPSVLLWAREPSILAVWREDDLLRRRARWIQVGGPHTDGPHARLDPPVTEGSLRKALEDLLGPFQEH